MTIVLPAHNEALVLEGCLSAIASQTTTRPLRVVVVANGCADETATIARRFQPVLAARGAELLVCELPGGGKPNALNHGDQFALPGARIYLDADVRLSPDAVEAVAQELERPGVLLCAPKIIIGPSRSYFTKCYAAIWTQLPVVKTGVVGCGMYAVNAQGRMRWGAFPPIIADDKYVRLHFESRERRVTPRGFFVARLPDGLRELVTVRSRWARANDDLMRLFPDVARREPSRLGQLIGVVARRPDLWLALLPFLLVFLLAQVASVRHRNRGVDVWERADLARAQIRKSDAFSLTSKIHLSDDSVQ